MKVRHDNKCIEVTAIGEEQMDRLSFVGHLDCFDDGS